MRTRGVDVADTKSSPIDIVTEADRACEELIRQRLLGARPDDGFVGEEGDDIVGSSGVSWVVDPIDGTVNYLYGLPHYAVSIAAARDGRGRGRRGARPWPSRSSTPRPSVVAPPATAYPSEVRTTPPLDQALVATGFGYETDIRTRQAACGRADAAAGPRHPAPGVVRARPVRGRPPGQSDAYVEEGAYAWDHAAGGLVATEAGATFEVWTTVADRDLVVCAPAPGWTEFEALVRACGFLGDDAG